MNHMIQKDAPIHAVPNGFWNWVTVYRILVQSSLENIWYIPKKEL
jgi:hypothetical protein